MDWHFEAIGKLAGGALDYLGIGEKAASQAIDAVPGPHPFALDGDQPGEVVLAQNDTQAMAEFYKVVDDAIRGPSIFEQETLDGATAYANYLRETLQDRVDAVDALKAHLEIEVEKRAGTPDYAAYRASFEKYFQDGFGRYRDANQTIIDRIDALKLEQMSNSQRTVAMNNLYASVANYRMSASA